MHALREPDLELASERTGATRAWLPRRPRRSNGMTPVCYHPDPEINVDVALDVLAAETADLAAGYPPRRWVCPCGKAHSRGHFLAIGQHRCLSCGYVGTGG